MDGSGGDLCVSCSPPANSGGNVFEYSGTVMPSFISCRRCWSAGRSSKVWAWDSPSSSCMEFERVGLVCMRFWNGLKEGPYHADVRAAWRILSSCILSMAGQLRG